MVPQFKSQFRLKSESELFLNNVIYFCNPSNFILWHCFSSSFHQQIDSSKRFDFIQSYIWHNKNDFFQYEILYTILKLTSCTDIESRNLLKRVDVCNQVECTLILLKDSENGNYVSQGITI